MRSVFSGTRNERGTHSLHGLLGPDSNPVRKRQVVKHATGCLTPMAISSHWLSQTESSSSSARTLSRARPKPGTTVANLEQLRHVDSRFLVSGSGHCAVHPVWIAVGNQIALPTDAEVVQEVAVVTAQITPRAHSCMHYNSKFH